MHRVAVVSALAGLVGGPGCGLDYAEDCPSVSIAPGSHHVCAMPGWVDRAFDLDVPASWNGSSPLPVIVMFHGGGGNRGGANRTTCPEGDEHGPGCLVAMAAARGYVVVAPDGTGSSPLRGIRTWNGGGGHALQCTSGGACRAGVDDVRYVRELLDRLGTALPIDAHRIYATGISNGGAMSHRVACELPDRIAAIVPVAGENEWADDGGACDVQVPVRDIHGTLDPCWAFDGGPAACAQDDGQPKTSVATTQEGWRVRNGCASTFTETALPDLDPADGTTATLRTFDGCAAAVELLRIDGGGHTWPGGWPYLSEDRVGRVSHDVDNAAVLDFFDAHVHP